MKVSFFQFSKRTNSTKVPDAETIASGLTYDNVYFKDDTNLNSPTLLIDGNLGGVYAANYMYIHDWSWYYFITDITFVNYTMSEVHCEIDVLATFKTAILSQSAFIVYSTSNFNRWLKDERIPIVIKDSEIIGTHSSIISSADDEPVFQSSATNETVILSAVSADMGLMHYVLDEDTLQDVAASLCHADINQFLDDLMQQFGDAVGSIVQIRRIPVNPNVLATVSLGTIYLGAYEIPSIATGNPINATYLASTMVAASGSIGVPLTHTDFRYTEPYCTARLSLPFVGVVDISISDFPDGSIYWKMGLDVVSGTVLYTLYNSDNNAKPVATYSGECGMLIPIASAQIANTGSIVTSAASGAVGLVAGSASGNPAAILGGIMGITQAFTATLQKSMSVIGSYSGNRSEFFNTMIRLVVEKYATALEPADLAPIEGRPCCQVLTLTNLTGYVRTEGYSFAGPVNNGIKEKINALLDSGIYIE